MPCLRLGNALMEAIGVVRTFRGRDRTFWADSVSVQKVAPLARFMGKADRYYHSEALTATQREHTARRHRAEGA